MDENSQRALKREEWSRALVALQGKVSGEEERVLRMLADGKTQPQIADVLGMHRSAIWRRARKLRARVSGLTSQP